MSRRSDAGRGALEDLAQTRFAPPPIAGDPVAEVELILERVRHLRYDHNNPERFHAERSDIAGAIGGLLKRMRGRTGIGPALLPVASAVRRRQMPPLPPPAAFANGVDKPSRAAARETLRLKDRS